MHFGFKRIEGDIQILLMSSFTLGAPSIKIADKRLSKMILLVLLNTWATKPPTSIYFQARPFCRPPNSIFIIFHGHAIRSFTLESWQVLPGMPKWKPPFGPGETQKHWFFINFINLTQKTLLPSLVKILQRGWNSKIKVQLRTSRIPEVLKGTLSKPKQKPELSTFSRTVQAIDDPCPYHGFTILFLGSPASLSAAGTFSISWWRVWLSRRRAYHLNFKKLMIFLGYFRVLCYFYWYFMFGLDFASFFF